MKKFGLLIVDKSVGPTSHRVVNLVRKGTGIRKVGHAGTLDPRASGVLVLCLGAATRLSEYLSTTNKRYTAVVRFGISTQTYDADGAVTAESMIIPTLQEIEAALPSFRGSIQQVPPPYSAIKLQGKKAYELAREGQVPELEAREVVIHELELVSYEPPNLTLKIESSAGTYIRSLANDLGESLSTGAHLASLRRTKAGPFTIEEAVPLPELELSFDSGSWEQYIRPAKEALPDLPEIPMKPEEEALIFNGQPVPAGIGSSGMARAIGTHGDLIAILEFIEDQGHWQPRKVFMP